MNNNLTVTRIVTIYKTDNNTTWQRNFFDTRKLDGIVFFIDGEIKYHFAHKDMTARGGDIVLMPGNLPYSGKMISKSVSFIAVDFACLGTDELERLGTPAVINSKKFDSLLETFKDISHRWINRLVINDLEIKAFIYSVLSEIYNQDENLRNVTPTDKILEYIRANLSSPDLSLEEIEKTFFISESQLRRNIYKRTGLSPNEYITSQRINKAKTELSATDKLIKEISTECGFSSPYYFSKVFSSKVGMSPTEYKVKIHH